MIRTEAEWLETWCPLTRTLASGVVNIQAPGKVPGLTHSVAAPVSATVNRVVGDISNKHGIPEQCLCIGRKCSGFEFLDDPILDILDPSKESGILLPTKEQELNRRASCHWMPPLSSKTHGGR